MQKRISRLEQATVVRIQSDQYGGFCGICGEAIAPLYKNKIMTFDLCPFKGTHPKNKVGYMGSSNDPMSDHDY